MAHSPKLLISFIFLVTVLLFSAQIQARDSQFFSKVSATTNNENTVVTVPNNNEQQQALNKQEQDPTFIPETQNGYGLYGHESTENIHATTTTYTPYTTQPQETNSAYEGQQQNLGETRLQESGYTTMSNENSNNNQYYYNNGRGGYNNVPSYQENNNNYDGRGGYNKVPTTPGGGHTTTLANQENSNKYDGRGGYNRVPTTPGGGHTTTLANQENINNNKYRYDNNAERQGMSDTRFLENGKYSFHVNNEQKYYPNQYEQNSRGVASRNDKYNTAGGYYGNTNENANSVEGYQNNKVEEKEFAENAEFEP